MPSPIYPPWPVPTTASVVPAPRFPTMDCRQCQGAQSWLENEQGVFWVRTWAGAAPSQALGGEVLEPPPMHARCHSQTLELGEKPISAHPGVFPVPGTAPTSLRGDKAGESRAWLQGRQGGTPTTQPTMSSQSHSSCSLCIF